MCRKPGFTVEYGNLEACGAHVRRRDIPLWPRIRNDHQSANLTPLPFPFRLPPRFQLLLSSFILHPSSFILHPSSFIIPTVLLFSCHTPAHKVLYRQVFLPSVPEGFEVRSTVLGIDGPGDFLSDEFLRCTRAKPISRRRPSHIL